MSLPPQSRLGFASPRSRCNQKMNEEAQIACFSGAFGPQLLGPNAEATRPDWCSGAKV
jgi:hypothetical protein